MTRQDFEEFNDKICFDYYKNEDHSYNENLFHKDILTLTGIKPSKEEQKLFEFCWWSKGYGVHLRYIAGIYFEMLGINTMGVRF